MVKGFRQIASLTALSRVFGLIRDMCYSNFLGAGGLMDAWTIAFKIPNLARRLFGEGAASASLIPIYAEELASDRAKAKKLADTVVSVIFVILAGFVLLGWLLMWLYCAIGEKNPETKLILTLSSVMLPYTLMICTVAILAGILNVHRHFATPAAAPIVLNIFIITSILVSGWAIGLEPAQIVFVAAVAVLLSGVTQIAMQMFALKAHGVHIRPAWDIHSAAFKKILLLMAPMIIGLTATQINTLFDDVIAWLLSGSAEKGDIFVFFGRALSYPLKRGSVSHLYYAQRLYQMPLGVLGISFATAIFPAMSAAAAGKDHQKLTETITKSIKFAVFIAIPATAGLILVAKPLIMVIFEHGKFSGQATDATAWTLYFYSLGLCGFFAQQVLTRAFYSLQDSKTPMRSAIIAVCLNIFLNLTLIWPLGTGGLALSTAICSYLQVVLLITDLRRRFGRTILLNLRTTIIKTVIGAVIMTLSAWILLYMMRTLPQTRMFNIIRIAVIVPSAGAVYYLAAKLLRNASLSLLGGSAYR